VAKDEYERVIIRRLNSMDLLDFIKATVVCGSVAFLCYTFPVLGQVVIIGVLSLIWLGYARKFVLWLRQR